MPRQSTTESENTMPSNAVIIGLLAGLGAQRLISTTVVLTTTLSGHSPAKDLGVPLYVSLEILSLISSGILGGLVGKAYNSREPIKEYCKAGWNNFCGYFAGPTHDERIGINTELGDTPRYT